MCINDRITKVEKGYYADGEDAYEMDKFFKPHVEKNIMKKVVQPLVSLYPGAMFPLVEYEELKKLKKEEEIEPELKSEATSEVKSTENEVKDEVKEEVKKGKKKRKKKK